MCAESKASTRVSDPLKIPGLDPNESRVLVVGLGKTGLSAIRFLRQIGVNVAVTDTRSDPPGLSEVRDSMADLPVFVGGFHSAALTEATHLLVSPGVSLKLPEIERSIRGGKYLLSDIDLFACYAEAPVVAITGSNGKSTVTSLLGLMAETAGKKVKVGGNLGTPALDLLVGDEPDLYVLELSSFQLERMELLRPAAAVVLNITPDHLDRYENIHAYAQEKQRIFNGQGVMVLNGDDELVRKMARTDRTCVYFGSSSKAFRFHTHPEASKEWIFRGNERLLECDQLKIRGHHNHSNALAAMALGEAVDLPIDAMLKALTLFPGLDHRMQWVDEIDGVQWINDSKATNTGACFAALEGLSDNIVLIAGGDGKGADFSDLAGIVSKKVRAAILIGKDAERLKKVLADKTHVIDAGNLDNAVAKAKTLSMPGDTVLLSPACASLDQFTSYQERGAKFVEAVRRK